MGSYKFLMIFMSGFEILYGLIDLMIQPSISFFTMIYFGVKTYSAMRNFQYTSSSTKNLQTQLFYSLVIQTIIPVILIHFPTTLIYVSTFFDAAYEFYGKVVTVTIALFPAIDPLPSLIIIKPYKQAIKNCFKKTLNVKGMSSVEASTRVTSTIMSRPGNF
uniref:Serpentine receptor class gamma n=1 Tax=Caenorhabditis tropicalis TaxID=1561998 RepID=A0A1I7UWJ4_9PELO